MKPPTLQKILDGLQQKLTRTINLARPTPVSIHEAKQEYEILKQQIVTAAQQQKQPTQITDLIAPCIYPSNLTELAEDNFLTTLSLNRTRAPVVMPAQAHILDVDSTDYKNLVNPSLTSNKNAALLDIYYQIVDPLILQTLTSTKLWHYDCYEKLKVTDSTLAAFEDAVLLD